ncbi:MAG: TonB-dependent receptor [Siphonobacter aquaeclarae]|nr:TonB-dependent receptor [Siphonobacter aquaeclarae]
MENSVQTNGLLLRIMRVSVTQLCLALTTVSLAFATEAPGQNVLERPVSIRAENRPLKNVLGQLEKETQVRFTYSPKAIRADRPASVTAVNQSLGQVLPVLLDPLGISYRVTGPHSIVLNTKEEVPAETEPARQVPVDRILTGRVSDTQGNGLPGVNVVVRGTQRGATTGENGNYRLEIPDGPATLVFSSVGYLTREVSADGRTSLDISLEADVRALNEVVVVGYGQVKKSDLTGSVSSISSKNITQVKAVSNIAQALQGQAAGVQVIQRSGQPGEYVSIKIRGTNSIAGGNDPLYVVDGLPLDGLSAQLNPDDIEQIEVLKDASATAIYGSRGANGVVLISTKKGKEGKVQVTYNGYLGVQTLRRKIKLINARQFGQLQNEVATNDGQKLPWTASQLDSLGTGTDWQDLVYRPARVQNHDIALSGGSASTRYYTSFGYFDQDGIIENSNFRRLSFRGNLDQKINEKLDVNVSLSLQQSRYFQADYPSADGGGVPFQTMVMPPTVSVYSPGGDYTRFTGVSWGTTNPVGTAREKWNPSLNLRILGNAALSYQIIKGLKLRLSAGLDNNWNKNDSYIPATISQGAPNGRASKSYSNSMTFVNENLLTYARQAGKHTFDVLGGITFQSNKSENLSSGTAIDFLTDLYQNNNIQSANTKAQPSTGYSDYTLVSYLGRLNYNFGGKYFATVTGRYDGSSKFGENNKFAFFPSGALAWRVSEEPFMKSLPSLSNLKLRASYGKSGNQAISAYQTLANLSNVSVTFNNQVNVGYVQGALENRNLKWETTAQLDLGIDIGLFNERVQFTADYYNKKTTDLLLNVTLPPTSGFGSVLQNIGAVRNRGFEFQLTTQNTTGDVKWSSVLTFSHNRTKVLDLGKDASGKPLTYKEVGTGGNWFPIITGQSMMQLYGYKVLGIYQSDEEAKTNGEPTKKAGDYKFQNTDGNSVIDGNDRITLTRLEPKFTFGFNNTISYKQFDLTLLFVGSYGNDIVNEFRKYNITMNGRWTPTLEAFNGRWTGTGNQFDRPSANSGSAIRDYANSLWVENGSYLKLRDITLGYSLSKELLRSLKIASARVYVSAQNYLTLTKYTGYDPEASWSAASINGWDRGVYPSMKSITGGVKINF